ncbi:tetratricopeptide repeat protein [Myxococcota bacterium]|nr:tetratricopeptide repeat protein [Myxococcota bacterium]MBU1379685.1 tetratricopeptide repeat protein [Myxococcota bacterium]MBU1496896.1 tetratricopeptide repeat protein [Myxococcota bacterium]
MKILPVLLIIFSSLPLSCKPETDENQLRYARKQYYLGNDYFSRYIEALRKIDKLRIENEKLGKSLSKLSLSGDQTVNIQSIRTSRAIIQKNNQTIEKEETLAKRYLDAALIELLKAVTSDPKMFRAYFEIALIYLKKATTEIDMGTRVQCYTGDEKKENREKSRSLLQKARKHFIHSAKEKDLKSQSYNNVSAIDLYLEEWETALGYAKLAISDLVYQDSHVAQSNIGWALFHMKKYSGAISHFRQSLLAQRHFCIARYRLARTYFAMGKTSEAETEFDRTIKQGYPCNGIQEAWLYGAMSKLKNNKLDQAKDYLKKCVSISPSSCVAAECKTLLKSTGD